MAKKLIALATADIHFHHWKQFNETGERTQISINFLANLLSKSHEAKIPILHAGDLFHTPKGLTTATLREFNIFMKTATEVYPNAKILGITGNHDGTMNESLWAAACFAFPKILYNLDSRNQQIGDGVTVFGLSWRKRNKDLVDDIKTLSSWKQPKILLIHTELYGTPDPSGYEPEPQNIPRNLGSLFKGFDLVLAGHVHKHTKVYKNIYMVGAPNQQRSSDSGCTMGYLEIYDDFSIKFVENDYPEFKYYKEGEEHPDNGDFWIEIPNPKKLEKGSEAAFSPKMKKTTMAKKYMKEKGIKSPKKRNSLISILNQTDD